MQKNLKLFIIMFISLCFISCTQKTSTHYVSPATSVNSDNTDVVIESLLNLPYRVDGAIDENGRFVLFADTEKTFDSPGLNCSGLTLEISRILLNKNLTLNKVKHDRLNDSGPNSPHGQDWDFGWDFIMNISDG